MRSRPALPGAALAGWLAGWLAGGAHLWQVRSTRCRQSWLQGRGGLEGEWGAGGSGGTHTSQVAPPAGMGRGPLILKGKVCVPLATMASPEAQARVHAKMQPQHSPLAQHFSSPLSS